MGYSKRYKNQRYKPYVIKPRMKTGPRPMYAPAGIYAKGSMVKRNLSTVATMYNREYNKSFPYRLNQVFKPRLFKKLTYTQTVTLTSSTTGNSSGGAQLWRLNSVFDPDYSGVGHQPLWFDEIKALGYTNYLVHGANVDLTFTDPSADGMYVAYGLDSPALDDPINNVFHDYLKEYPRTIVRYVNNTGSQKVTAKFYASCPKACNVSKLRYNTNPDYSALTSAAPTKSPMVQVVCGNINPSANTATTIQCTIKLQYFCEFFDSDNYPSPS